MKTMNTWACWFTVMVMWCMAAGVAQAKIFVWNGNSSALWNVAGNWTNNALPSASDTVLFDANSVNNLATTLGATRSVGGLKVTSPGGNVSIGGGSSYYLTVGSGGVDMSLATRDLSTDSTLTAFAIGADQTWNIASNRTLTLSQNIGPWGSTGRSLTLDGGGSLTLNGTWIQAGVGGNPGTINHKNLTLSSSVANTLLFVGNSAVGTYNLQGGTINLTGSQEIRLGQSGATADGTFNLTNGTIASTGANTSLSVAQPAGCKGTYNQIGGNATFGTINISSISSNTIGAVTLSGGSLTNTTLNIGTYNSGGTGTGTMTLTNTGVLNLLGTATVGSSAGSSGMLNLNGGTINFMTTSANLVKGVNGTLTANGIKFSNQTGTSAGVSTGNVVISASMVLGAGGLTVLPSAGASRWVQLNGNLSGAGGVTFDSQGFNSCVLAGANNTFLGGITVASGYFGNNSSGAVPVGSAVSLAGNWGFGASATIGSLTGSGQIFSGPGTVYTLAMGANDASSTFSGPMGVGASTTFALNKIGSGTLTLNGFCTHLGGTIVSNGTLDVGGRMAPTNGTAVTVASLGCLAGTGRVDRVVMEDGGRLMPGTAAACGTLTASNLTLSANSVVVINAGEATNSTLNVTGVGTTLSGTVRVESVGGKNIRRIAGLNIPNGYTGAFSKVESSAGNFLYVAVYGDKTVTLVPMIGTMIRVL